MDTIAADSHAHEVPPAARVSRLLLAGCAAVVLASLAWAAVRVQEMSAEVTHLRQDLAIARRAERAAGAAARAVPVEDHGARAAEWERRFREMEAAAKQTAEKAAAREKELDGIITFLREENVAAQQTIERLTNPPAPEEPAPPPASETRPRRNRR